ncbi:S-layer homology domain-containing protein [Ureibacillus aquaedulcis]|uniref:S-layer homology domain-containing protein n=1 Tax=Ureibacillus aquaedulcis TaxID=3058421 RepID=A0ABT8GL49_9BACL|nr:S-layer homology domain-containing protein [Ureibacillus sp. BA0131]MDN4492142.1 S-layer homology domain-containing protein [Ureibacillus sp. BA0131]
MKRRLSVALGLGLFIAAGTVSPTISHAEDLSGHWAYNELNYLIDNDILKGDQLGNYLPNKDVTRAEFATFLVRALELPAVSTTSNFNDVAQVDWFYDSVNRASSFGLIEGDGKGGFKPNDKINRQQMAVMIKRALDYLNVETSATSLKFNDNSSIAPWAKEDVQHVVTSGYIVGKPNNLFAPLAQATRAEAATVIYRVLNPSVLAGKEYHTTNYQTDFATAVYLQSNNSPKVDGAGLFTATKSLAAYYMNPGNFSKDSDEYYQFLKLSTPVANLKATTINDKVLYGKGILSGTADAFIQAGLDYEINAIYLMSHALHETGNGTSKLANGIEVGVNAEGKPEMVTTSNRSNLKDIKTTYNFYGIGAIDKDANKYGSETAYQNGWFTVRQAIVGGAKFVKDRYIGIGQDTLYEMRWNPAKPTDHQYATHVMWAVIQADKIRDIYELTGANESTKLVFDVPQYSGQPATSPMPAIQDQYVVYPTLNGATGKVVSPTIPLNFRSYPVYGTVIATLANDTEVTVLGENGGWYKITANGKTGWVSGQYLTFPDALKIKNNNTGLNVRSQPNTTSSIIGMAKANGYILGVKDENGQFIKEGLWYKVLYNQEPGWVHGDYIVQPSQPKAPVTTP